MGKVLERCPTYDIEEHVFSYHLSFLLLSSMQCFFVFSFLKCSMGCDHFTKDLALMMISFHKIVIQIEN